MFPARNAGLIPSRFLGCDICLQTDIFERMMEAFPQDTEGRTVARKTAVNQRYLFLTSVLKRTLKQEFRFWRVQVVQLFIFLAAALRSPERQTWSALLGMMEGVWAAGRLRTNT